MGAWCYAHRLKGLNEEEVCIACAFLSCLIDFFVLLLLQQVKYVVELARALAMMPEVYRVDLLTRQICSPDVDWSYGEPTEMLSMASYEDAEDEVGESSGAYIVRIPCGPRYFNLLSGHTTPISLNQCVWYHNVQFPFSRNSALFETRTVSLKSFIDHILPHSCGVCYRTLLRFMRLRFLGVHKCI